MSISMLEKEQERAMAAYEAMKSNRDYYDQVKDHADCQAYYRDINWTADALKQLLESTHHNHLAYSPHQYVYPWVDLQENGKLKSLYSGRTMEPLEIIEEDIRILKQQAMSISRENDEIEGERMVNCDHVVPQSWFGKKSPMKGDLHHLFACDPGCNSRRGNSVYYDFFDYIPERVAAGITEGCGKAEDGKFEPEYGKGTAARASLYFFIRYKDTVPLGKLDLSLLWGWHEKFPVSVYEKHRNQAIFEMQGNRNPFIDFPDHAKKSLNI